MCKRHATVNDYIEEGIKKAGNAYRLAGEIGRTAGYINQLKRGFSGASDDTLIRLARYIGADESELLLLYHTTKATGPSKETWETITKKCAGAAGACGLLAKAVTYFSAIF